MTPRLHIRAHSHCFSFICHSLSWSELCFFSEEPHWGKTLTRRWKFEMNTCFSLQVAYVSPKPLVLFNIASNLWLWERVVIDVCLLETLNLFLIQNNSNENIRTNGVKNQCTNAHVNLLVALFILLFRILHVCAFKLSCRYSEQVECVIFSAADLCMGRNICHSALPLWLPIRYQVNI